MAVVIICTLFGKILDNFFEPIDQIMIYLIGAIIVAARFGKRSSILFSFLSVTAFNFFFVEPLYDLRVADGSYWLTFFVMLMTSLFITNQATKLKMQAFVSRKNILLSSISHDLRTPLSSIIGASETILADSDKLQKDSVIQLSKLINVEALRLAKIVTNLLDITNIESGNFKLNKQPYYIQEIIGSIITRMKAALENYQVNVFCENDLPMVLIDGVLIEQVITNLLENAVKYTPKGTVINISVKKEAKGLLVEIADNGPGIIYKNHQRDGYGLGLMICHAIMKIHNSWFKIDDAKSKLGAHFSFLLPEIISIKNYDEE